jgi:hypothetical protein
MSLTITQTVTPYAIEEDKVITYPSPARGERLYFYYRTEGPAQIRIKIYNVLGELCDTLTGQPGTAGQHRISWDISNAAPGVYLYQLVLEDSNGTRKLPMRKLVIVK